MCAASWFPMSAHGAGEVPERVSLRQDSAGRDDEPLLPDGESGLLRRVVTGLQLPGAWRLFSWPSSGDESAGSGAQSAGDVESGEQEASNSGEERRVGGSAAAGWAGQDGDADARGSAGVPVSAPECVHAAHSPRTASGSPGAAVDVGRPAAALAGANSYAEITAAEMPVEAAAVQEAGAGGEEQEIAGAAGESGRSLTLGERVASIGRDLLGIGKAEAASESGSKAGDSGPSVFKALLGGSGGGESPPRSPNSQPTCLICLEQLMNEDFMSGEAISLDCQCRGELALRHRTCALKWSRVKGDNICDICRAPVKNLPAPSPRGSSSSESDIEMGDEYAGAHGGLGLDAMPGNADLVFDCIRVTWVAMIVCILFFSMDLSTALWTGIIVGMGYTMFVRAMYSQQIAVAHMQMALAAQEAARQAEGASPVAPAAAGVPGVPPPAFMHQMIV